ncbi:MAG: hypothetical protein KA304_06650, partial [Aeromonas sp.]|nr:hypothetical protein [Aeromonas sp.]
MMVSGATAPRVVNHDHIVRMKPGSAIVGMTQIRAKQEAPHPYTSGLRLRQRGKARHDNAA